MKRRLKRAVSLAGVERTQPHDRQSKDLLRNAVVAPIEVGFVDNCRFIARQLTTGDQRILGAAELIKQLRLIERAALMSPVVKVVCGAAADYIESINKAGE